MGTAGAGAAPIVCIPGAHCDGALRGTHVGVADAQLCVRTVLLVAT